jgi:YD repeat-containing protein
VLVAPTPFGEAVALTAQVISPGGPVAEGTVTFTVGGRTAVAQVNPAGQATAIVGLPALTTGTPLAVGVSYDDNGAAFAPSASGAAARFILADALLPGMTNLSAGGGETITDAFFGLWSLTRSYDAEGRLTEVDFDGIRLETFGYDARGQLAAVGVVGVQVPLPVTLPPQLADVLFQGGLGLPLGV